MKERKEKQKWQTQKELSTPKITGKLLEEKPFETIGSVVENSTELLSIENKTRKFE